jgi:hypothetical protein
MTDDKFTDYAIKHFSVGGTSEFVLVYYWTNKLTHIKNVESIRMVKYDSQEYRELKNRLGEYNCVFTHGLFEKWQEDLVLATPAQTKVAWMFLGGEVYGLPYLRKTFFDINTRVLYWCKTIVYKLKKKSLDKEYSRIADKTFRRIDYCVTDSLEEYNYANAKLGVSMKHIWYNYYSIEETVGDLQSEYVKESNILLGNSCSFECNHLTTMRKLSRIDLKNNQNVILPLSYGDAWLRQRLIKIGPRIIGKQFKALTDFMPREEYNKILISCGVVIMPHYRPNAFGNILTALWLGAKVFVSKHSLVFPFYTRLGLVVYTIEDDLTNVSVSTLLSAEHQQHNRTVLLDNYGSKAMRSRINQLIEQLNA